MKRMHPTSYLKVRDLMHEYPFFDKQLATLGNDPDSEGVAKEIRRKQKAIRDCLANTGDESFNCYITLHYFKGYSVQKALLEACYSCSTIKRKQKRLFKQIADELAIYWEE
ncbi:hypothetical protein [Candidatus Enterococcus clewellii]|uniref:Uncharacterized protein n=1 Tax=Candidatus Enterococcus clewellii TaxID=1834193 RepID=A0A242JWN5_9ENTE|nr:hypothetical protein [Enterococcus sp. 9E7_DIV0242]OTP06688.1 hypothetical protein A5888_004232 [Enterococcus sp. 9E7_DIV0242]